MGVLKQVQKFFKGVLGIKSDSMDLKDLKINESTRSQRDQDRDSYSARQKDYRGGNPRSGGRNYRNSGGRPENRSGSGGGSSSQGQSQAGQGQGHSRDSRDSRDRNPNYNRDRSPSAPRDRGGYDRGRGGRPSSRDRGGNRQYGSSGGSGGGNRYSQRPSASSLPREERKFLVGTVTQYLAELSVAIVKVQKGAVQVNDLLAFEGEKTKFRQKITSLEMNHQPVTVGRVGEEVGMKVQDPVIEGDQVFRVDYVSAGR